MHKKINKFIQEREREKRLLYLITVIFQLYLYLRYAVDKCIYKFIIAKKLYSLS